MKERFFLKHLDLIKKSIISRRDDHLLETVDELVHTINCLKEHKHQLQDLNRQKNKNIEFSQDAATNKLQRKALETRIVKMSEKVQASLAVIPNVVDDSEGIRDEDHYVVSQYGKFSHQNDKSSSAIINNLCSPQVGLKISGRKFCFLHGILAKLYRMLSDYMVFEAEKFFVEVHTPVMVKSETLFKSGHLPKFADDMFQVEKDSLYLVPTSEVTILGFLSDRKITAKERYFARTECFRREIGKISEDNIGIKRMHQFTKVELFSVCSANESKTEHEFLTYRAQQVLINLEIPYRTILLPPHDLGFAAFRTYDIEAWLPVSKTFIEVSSSSNCTNFQSMRANIKTEDGEYAHTLNCSGMAVGRVMMAMLENDNNIENWILKLRRLLGLDSNQQPND